MFGSIWRSKAPKERFWGRWEYFRVCYRSLNSMQPAHNPIFFILGGFLNSIDVGVSPQRCQGIQWCCCFLSFVVPELCHRDSIWLPKLVFAPDRFLVSRLKFDPRGRRHGHSVSSLHGSKPQVLTPLCSLRRVAKTQILLLQPAAIPSRS